MTRDQLWGADRAVLYLPAATQTLDEIDGSRESGITNEAEKFLGSPRTAWDKHPEDYLWQIRHLGSNTRAFATWCQNEEVDFEMLIVQDIYKKANEDDYWDDTGEYNEAGRKYNEMFAALSREGYEEWIDSVADRDGFRLVLGD